MSELDLIDAYNFYLLVNATKIRYHKTLSSSENCTFCGRNTSTVKVKIEFFLPVYAFNTHNTVYTYTTKYFHQNCVHLILSRPEEYNLFHRKLALIYYMSSCNFTTRVAARAYQKILQSMYNREDILPFIKSFYKGG